MFAVSGAARTHARAPDATAAQWHSLADSYCGAADTDREVVTAAAVRRWRQPPPPPSPRCHPPVACYGVARRGNVPGVGEQQVGIKVYRSLTPKYQILTSLCSVLSPILETNNRETTVCLKYFLC